MQKLHEVFLFDQKDHLMQNFKEILLSGILRQTKSDEVFLFLHRYVWFNRFLQKSLYTPIKVSSRLLSFC